MHKSIKYTYQVGHGASKISPIVALMDYIVNETKAAFHLCHVLRGKFPYIEHRPRRVLRIELGTLTNKLGSNSLTQILEKVERSFHKDLALCIKLCSFKFKRKDTVAPSVKVFYKKRENSVEGKLLQ